MRGRAAWATLGAAGLVALGAAPGLADAAVELFTPTDPQLVEISGITADPSGARFWVDQDAGRPQEVYQLDSSGDTVATVRPTGVTVEDPEDIALMADGSVLLADTGDAYQIRKEQGNPKPRTRFQIVRFPAPATSPVGAVLDVPAESLPFRYPDGKTHNVEGMAVDQVRRVVYLFEKLQTAGRATIWALSLDATSEGTPRVVGSIPITGISSAVMGPERAFVAVRDARTAYLYPVRDGDVGAALRARPTEVALPSQPQGEAMTVSAAATDLVVASEGAAQPIWAVALPKEFVVAVPPVVIDGKTGPGNALVTLGLALGAGALGLAVIAYGLWRKSHT